MPIDTGTEWTGSWELKKKYVVENIKSLSATISMAKFTDVDGAEKAVCSCGKLVSSSPFPNDIQLRVYTDFEWDTMLTPDIVNPNHFPLPSHDVWRCPKCENIYVYEWDSKIPIKVYRLED